MSFVNKVAIVTGASSGIGAATAVAFAKELADVTIVGRNETKLNNVAEQCAKFGKQPLIIKADVSSDESCTSIIEKTVEKFGKLDILINNAGIFKFGSVSAGNIMQTYDEVLNTNLRSVVLLTTLATPHLVKTKGNVVNISSIGGTKIQNPIGLAYCISKAGMNHFSSGAALDLAGAGVRVNTVSPGPVKTDIIDNSGFPTTWEDFAKRTALERCSDASEVADLVLFLASEKARGITGSNYFLDNGMMVKN